MKYVLKRAKTIKELLPQNFNRIKGVGTLKDRGCDNDAARRNITNFFPKVSLVRTNKFFQYILSIPQFIIVFHIKLFLVEPIFKRWFSNF